MNIPVQVMKFGGTSVGDAACIARVAKILAEASRQGPVIAVVSAMSGVTNKLVDAATKSGNGEGEAAAVIFEALHKQHEVALGALMRSSEHRERIAASMEEIFAEGERLCKGTALLRELTPRTLDAISSLGERLSAPMVAGALQELGVRSEAVEATELIVTDPYHGGADPIMDKTRRQCEARLRPMLQDGVVPVVTGFIGATEEGVLTTLGRGGSDYSATILGAAMAAEEIIIWTDVDGVLTADPRLVAEARTIPEISYREATELAYFGAKVLHPKTLRAVAEQGIPVWIRNSFSPEKSGTKITPKGRSNGGGVKALTAIKDVTLISLGGPGIVGDAGRGGADVLDDRGSTCQCTADFSIVIAKRYLLHRFVRGRKAHGGSAAQRIRAGPGARESGAHYGRPEHRHRRGGWRKYARHAGRGGAGVHRAGAGKCEHHRDRARVVGVEHFVCGGRAGHEDERLWLRTGNSDWARLSCTTSG